MPAQSAALNRPGREDSGQILTHYGSELTGRWNQVCLIGCKWFLQYFVLNIQVCANVCATTTQQQLRCTSDNRVGCSAFIDAGHAVVGTISFKLPCCLPRLAKVPVHNRERRTRIPSGIRRE